MIVDPISELPISGMAFNARIYDGEADEVLRPLLNQLRDEHPILKERIDKILGDGAFDSKDNRDASKEILEAALLTPINPRNRTVRQQVYPVTRKMNVPLIPNTAEPIEPIDGTTLRSTGKTHSI